MHIQLNVHVDVDNVLRGYDSDSFVSSGAESDSETKLKELKDEKKVANAANVNSS